MSIVKFKRPENTQIFWSIISQQSSWQKWQISAQEFHIFFCQFPAWFIFYYIYPLPFKFTYYRIKLLSGLTEFLIDFYSLNKIDLDALYLIESLILKRPTCFLAKTFTIIFLLCYIPFIFSKIFVRQVVILRIELVTQIYLLIELFPKLRLFRR